MAPKKRGRKCSPDRIKINALTIRSGRVRHLFSVITFASSSDVMEALQTLRDLARRPSGAPTRIRQMDITDMLNGLSG